MSEAHIPNDGQPFSYHVTTEVAPSAASAHNAKIGTVSAGQEDFSLSGSATSEIHSSIRGSLRRSIRKRPALPRRQVISYRRIRNKDELQAPRTSIAPSSPRDTLYSQGNVSDATVNTMYSVLSDDSAQISKRGKVLQELLETEKQYVEKLTLIQDAFIAPLVESLDTSSPLISRANLATIFSNLLDILNVNATLLDHLAARLQDLECCTDQSIAIGDIFTTLGPFLSCYKIYCQNFTASIAALETETRTNRLFRAFLQATFRQAALCKLPLASHLLLPVQRVPRYKLLLEQILRYTKPHEMDFVPITRALIIVSNVAVGIDEAIRRHEAWQSVYRLEKSFVNLDSPLTTDHNRKLLHRGPISKICRRTHQRRELFLFNDCIIYATPTVTGNILEGYAESYLFNRRLPLHSLAVQQFAPSNGQSRSVLKFEAPTKSFLAYCATDGQQDTWIEAINKAKLELSISQAILQTRQSSIGSQYITFISAPLSIPFISTITSTLGLSTSTTHLIIRGHIAPIWIEDSASPACSSCFYTFNLFRGRHHCRICGYIFCSSCSQRRFLVSPTSPLQRACESCYLAKEKQMHAAIETASLNPSLPCTQSSIRTTRRKRHCPILITTEN